MPAPQAAVLEAEKRDVSIVSSYKCEDCGKIIAAPADNPVPKCCGAEMRKIR